MKKSISALVAAIVICACSPKHQEQQVSIGTLDVYKDFQSEYVSPRTVRVWTPSSYDPQQKYDVLYMHDGQMLFDADYSWNHQEWGVDECLDSLISTGVIRPVIVVGIDNTDDRIGEYAPDDIAEFLQDGEVVYEGLPSLGNDYLRFIVEEVKPFVDSHYFTWTDADHTFVMGSSCGGLISSYALCKYPEVFGGAACLSTHCTLAYPNFTRVYPAEGAYLRYLEKYLPEANTRKLYMDYGNKTLDANYQTAQKNINAMVQSLGWDREHFMEKYFEGHEHSEDCWRSRLEYPVIFLLGKYQ